MLLFYAANVRTITSIYLDKFALVDEEGNTYLSTSLYGCRLEGIGCCITLDTGFESL